jgi:prepilin-type N-terminal cleavage/methylation domain-containing protein
MASLIPSNSHPSGFTLLEIMLTIGILAVILSLSSYGISSLHRRFASQSVDREITTLLTNAARRARLGVNNGAWGVYIPYNETTRSAETATLFHGTTYATRVVADDITIPINSGTAFVSVDFSGSAASTGNDHEIVFHYLDGSTTQYGDIVLQWFNQQRTVSISPDGIIVRTAL